jgi:hypothetical protein
MEIKASRAAWEEIEHKLNILADTEDLIDSYSLSAVDVENAQRCVKEAVKTGVLLTEQLPQRTLEMLAGEADDAAVIKRDNARGFLSDAPIRRQENAMARQLEALAAVFTSAAA